MPAKQVEASQPLAKQEHELFAAHVAAGVLTPSQAWTASGLDASLSPEKISSRAASLAKQKAVAARIAFFKAVAAKANRVDRDDVVTGLLGIARDPVAPAAARVSAWTAIGKYLGMFVNDVRVELSKPLSEMSDDELMALAASRELGR